MWILRSSIIIDLNMSKDISHVPSSTPYYGLIIRCPDFSKEEEEPVGEKEPADKISPPIGLIPPFASNPVDIAALAGSVSKDFPSIWFVNFPINLSGDQKLKLQKYQQDVLDYRSWSSLHWWNAVFQRYIHSVKTKNQRSCKVGRLPKLPI